MLELDVQKNLTTAFIATQPVDIVLIPHATVNTPSGGTRQVEGAPRDAQRMRLIEPGDSLARDPVRAADGFNRIFPDYMLLGEWDAVMDTDDTFTYDGDEFTIIQLMHFNGYERRGLVMRRGPR